MRFRDYLLQEMTSVLSDMSHGMEQYRQSMQTTILQDGKKIGEIEDLTIFSYTLEGYELYGLYLDDTLVSLVTGKMRTDIPNLIVFEVNGMVTHADFGGKGLTSKLFLFLKAKYSYKILIANIISKANKNNFDKLSLSDKFDIKWVNIKTGNIEPYKNNSFYNENGKPLDWQVLIETSVSLSIILEHHIFNMMHYEKADAMNYLVWNNLEGLM